MALFKPFKGNRNALDSVPIVDGHAYFCIDDGSFHIDYEDAEGKTFRKQISAENAEKLAGMSLEELKRYFAVQSDWNQVDETAIDFIKNKPFYEEEATFSELLFYEAIFEQVIERELSVEINEEETLTVVLGPVGWHDLECRLITDDEIPLHLYGNLALADMGEDTGEDFILIYGVVNNVPKMEFVTTIDVKDGEQLTITKVRQISRFKQIDEKFIPDTIAKQTDIVAVNSKFDELLDNVTLVTFTTTEFFSRVRFGTDLKNVYKIDWGDGNINDSLEHNYTKVGTYTCKIYGATEIGSNAFSFIDKIFTKIKIGRSVTFIRNSAFNGYEFLTDIDIPDSVTSIAGNAFYNCSALVSLEIPNSVFNTQDWRFSGCSALKSIVFGEKITLMHHDSNPMFEGCSSLVSITLKSPHTVGDYIPTLENLTSLEKIYVPYGKREAYLREWQVDGAPQKVLDKITELDKNAMMSDMVQEITVEPSQVKSYGKDTYTQQDYIRFTPTKEQEAILKNESILNIKLNLAALKSVAPAQEVWIRRNSKVAIGYHIGYQFSAGGEKFYYDNYTTNIAIKDIGNGALVYVPNFKTCDITMGSISIPDLYYKLGLIPTNLENGAKTGSIQQIADGVADGFDFTGKNPNATAYDPSLTGIIPYGATWEFASAFGGKCAAQGKRSHAEGTTTIAKGDYSHAEGNSSVTLGVNSHAEGVQTVSWGNGSHAEGSNTQALDDYAHAEGYYTKAQGYGAHAEGGWTEARSAYSHASGYGTIASCTNQMVVGSYNDNKKDSLFEVGNGTTESRSNAFEVLRDGRAKVYGTPLEDNDLITVAFMKQYIKDNFATLLEEYFANNQVTFDGGDAGSHEPIAIVGETTLV